MDVVDKFLERYAEYQASWKTALPPDILDLIRDAISSFLIYHEWLQDHHPANEAASILGDLKRVCVGNEAAENLLINLERQVFDLKMAFALSERAADICREHAIMVSTTSTRRQAQPS